MSGPQRPTSDDRRPDLAGSEDVTVVVPRPGTDETTVVVSRPDAPAAQPDETASKPVEPANPWYVEHRHDNPEQTAPAEQAAPPAPVQQPPAEAAPPADDPWATARAVPATAAQPVYARPVPPMQPLPAPPAPAVPAAPVKRGTQRLVMVAAVAVVLITAAGAAALLLRGGVFGGVFGGTAKELDVHAAEAGVQQVLTDPINGYGRDRVADVHCHNGQNIPVKAGTGFTCTVQVAGTPRQVKVQFIDDNGTYEIDRPTAVN